MIARSIRLLPALALGALVTSGVDEMRVVRTSPGAEATPNAVISVTFDRPVAGSLDRTVDPALVFALDPSVAGRFEWRDPITARFIPGVLLSPGTTYTVTVADTIAAMDGSRLSAPYQFQFVVTYPAVLAGRPAGPHREAKYMEADARFQVVLNAPADLRAFSATTRLVLDRDCGAVRIIPLRAVTQRRIVRDDPWEYQEAGGWQRDRTADSLRRVVTLEPATQIPLNCRGQLVVGSERYSFATYGPFQMMAATCGFGSESVCPTGYARVEFSTPVRGSAVLRSVRLIPPTTFTVGDTANESDRWLLQAELKPRTTYAAVADTSLRDVFGQGLTGNPARAFRTTGFAPTVEYPGGMLLVERNGFRTLTVKHINVDSLDVTLAPVPDSLEAEVLARPSWGLRDVWPRLVRSAEQRHIRVMGKPDLPFLSAIRMPAPNHLMPGAPTLTAVRIEPLGPGSGEDRNPIAIVQVTDLAVHARVGREEAAVWVTGAGDGRPRSGASVTVYDARGRVRGRATTDARGLALLPRLAPDSGSGDERRYGASEGYVAASLGEDRAVVRVDQYDPDLAAWRFNVQSAWSEVERTPAAGAVFSERGIYRPGETVHAKAIVRTGPLGALRVPAPSDSLRWVFQDRDEGVLKDTTVRLSPFGTSDAHLVLSASSPLGTDAILLHVKRNGGWLQVGRAEYRVAEYRPPEFLVDVATDTGARVSGDTLRYTVEARYLFGAPMARAPVGWFVRRQTVGPWEYTIPGTDGFYVGEPGSWWEEYAPESGMSSVMASGTDTLDQSGQAALATPLPRAEGGRASRVTVGAVVTDVNRQAVVGSASVLVHPAGFYVAARPLGAEFFWTAGKPHDVAVLAVTPDGRRLAGVAIHAAVVRREWHRVQRERQGFAEQVGEWVADTVASLDLISDTVPVVHHLTPAAGGSYTLSYRATDRQGRQASTTFYRWVAGPGWIPWSDENQFKMDVVPDRARYQVGDTAMVMLASPFTDAEAWVTVEREGLIEQRRLRLTSGAIRLTFPVTEAWAPNVFISVIVARGRSAPPGGIGDPGRPTIRVGYAAVRVTPEVKRLTVALSPDRTEYRPRDTALVKVAVTDTRGAGRRSEIALWAVDEAVLALTGYRTPDPIDLLYRPRRLGLRLGSNLAAVAEQIVQQEGISVKGVEEPGGGGGADAADVLRSRFASTAFFLGAVVTDSMGRASVRAGFPDNLTTFRLMAVAVTAGDRYGSGQSAVLVTRPLIARPALPRFLRPGDRFAAGIVANQRLGDTATVRVRASARGVAIVGDTSRIVTLAAGRGSEVRFDFREPSQDTSLFQFYLSSGEDRDAVESRLPTRPAYHPRAHTIAGALDDTAHVELSLPGDIDPTRSLLELSVGPSPLVFVGQARRFFRVYPYDCSEQVASAAMTAIAGLRVEAARPHGDEAALRDELRTAVATLSRRQRADGGIGLWAADDWTSPWLSAHSGEVLVQARQLGVAVDDSVLARLAQYLSTSLHAQAPVVSPVMRWYADERVQLTERVAAADLLNQLGRADLSAENELLRLAPQMTWEDRMRLGEMLARRGARDAARQLLESAWAAVRVEGRRAVLPPDAASSFYFPSTHRATARLLTATLAVDPAHPLIGPLVETLVMQGRVSQPNPWNTQDYGAVVRALAAFGSRQAGQAPRGIQARAGARLLALVGARGGPRDTTRSLAGLLVKSGDAQVLRLDLTAEPGSSAPVFYALTVHEVPRDRPVRPDQQGVVVERWYEDFATGKPVTSVTEGDLVRVRLRVTVTATREFLALEDPLPGGLEAVDVSLRTSVVSAGPGAVPPEEGAEEEEEHPAGGYLYGWYFGRWDSGWWTPFDHRELRDDRVVYVATEMWPGSYTASYVARATTPGVFTRPPAHAEEMYNPGVQGRSDGGVFTVTPKGR
jgi:uncharacterized protein YfaS (alpha-2-macroglobulin family)